jgi:hypothetical protein
MASICGPESDRGRKCDIDFRALWIVERSLVSAAGLFNEEGRSGAACKQTMPCGDSVFCHNLISFVDNPDLAKMKFAVPV